MSLLSQFARECAVSAAAAQQPAAAGSTESKGPDSYHSQGLSQPLLTQECDGCETSQQQHRKQGRRPRSASPKPATAAAGSQTWRVHSVSPIHRSPPRITPSPPPFVPPVMP